jgi:chromosome segregation ATPase
MTDTAKNGTGGETSKRILEANTIADTYNDVPLVRDMFLDLVESCTRIAKESVIHELGGAKPEEVPRILETNVEYGMRVQEYVRAAKTACDSMYTALKTANERAKGLEAMVGTSADLAKRELAVKKAAASLERKSNEYNEREEQLKAREAQYALDKAGLDHLVGINAKRNEELRKQGEQYQKDKKVLEEGCAQLAQERKAFEAEKEKLPEMIRAAVDNERKALYEQNKELVENVRQYRASLQKQMRDGLDALLGVLADATKTALTEAIVRHDKMYEESNTKIEKQLDSILYALKPADAPKQNA